MLIVNYPAYKAGHMGKAWRGIASPLPPLRIHPRPKDGVFCGTFIKGLIWRFEKLNPEVT